jgi:hypothetical protein
MRDRVYRGAFELPFQLAFGNILGSSGDTPYISILILSWVKK